MKLTTEQVDVVLQIATSYIGHPYGKGFRCVDFVRNVYGHVGIKIPKLTSRVPPVEYNITKKQLRDPPVGYLIFLKDRGDPRKYRAWTHVVIVMPDHCCIHCSLFFGKKVVISSLSDMYKKYDFAKSDTT